jgi:hypothetical protein
MSEPKFDSRTLNRLAFIRLLYRQAVEQSRQQLPLAALSVLTFHDTAEQFVILAAEHLRAPGVDRNTSLLRYFEILKPRNDFRGVELSGLHGIRRLNTIRNEFKHAGAMPNQENIDDARSAVTNFLEDNIPKVFGVEFSRIDLVDLVPQEDVRAKLRNAAKDAADNDYKAAMVTLAEAFDSLVNSHIRNLWGSSFEFGNYVGPFRKHLVGPTIRRLAARLPLKHQRRAAKEVADTLDDQLGALSNVTWRMQRGLRVLALGIDYGQYVHFGALMPTVVAREDGSIAVINSLAWAPNREEYDDCLHFVTTVALRIAELEANAAPASRRSS